MLDRPYLEICTVQLQLSCKRTTVDKPAPIYAATYWRIEPMRARGMSMGKNFHGRIMAGLCLPSNFYQLIRMAQPALQVLLDRQRILGQQTFRRYCRRL